MQMITKSKSDYYRTVNQKEWKLTIELPDDAPQKCLWQTWPLDEEPDIDGLPPSEVAELLFGRFQGGVHRETIDWIRANRARLDASWAEAEIERIEQMRTELNRRITVLRDRYTSR